MNQKFQLLLIAVAFALVPIIFGAPEASASPGLRRDNSGVRLPLAHAKAGARFVCHITSTSAVVEIKTRNSRRYEALSRFISRTIKLAHARGGAKAARRAQKKWRVSARKLRHECEGLLGTATPTPIPTPPTPTPNVRAEPFIYYSSDFTVNRISLRTGIEERNILQRQNVGLDSVKTLHYDEIDEVLFYVVQSSTVIGRLSFASGTTSEVATLPAQIEAVASDPASRRLFAMTVLGDVYQLSFDGTSVERVAGVTPEFRIEDSIVSRDGLSIVFNDSNHRLLRLDLSTDTVSTLYSTDQTIREFVEDPTTGNFLLLIAGQTELSEVSSTGEPIRYLPSIDETLLADGLRYLPHTDDFLAIGSMGPLVRFDRNGSILRNYQDDLDRFIGKVAVDPVSDRMFVSEVNAGGIYEVNLSDLSSRRIIVGRSRIGDLYVSPEAGRLFFSDMNRNEIVSANLDGSDERTVIHLAGSLTGLAYLPESDDILFGAGNLLAVKSDGSNLRAISLVPGVQSGHGNMKFDVTTEFNIISARYDFRRRVDRIEKLVGSVAGAGGSPHFSLVANPVIDMGLSQAGHIAQIVKDPSSPRLYFLTRQWSVSPTEPSEELQINSIYRFVPGLPTASLVDSNIGHPTSIDISSDGETLFWVDDQSDTVMAKHLPTSQSRAIGGTSGALLSIAYAELAAASE